MNDDTSIAQNDMEVALATARSIRLVPWYVASATVLMFMWLYLVVGEFVLAGLPEALGWFLVLGIVSANYRALRRQFEGYWRGHRVRSVVWNVLLTVAMILMVLLISMLIGSLLPEQVTTLLLLLLAGISTWAKRRVRMRVFPAVPRSVGWRLFAQFFGVGLVTVVAVAMLVTRS
jgi:hypothetical protein